MAHPVKRRLMLKQALGDRQTYRGSDEAMQLTRSRQPSSVRNGNEAGRATVAVEATSGYHSTANEERVMQLPTAKDKALFTPGPLTTSRTVKQAMLRDLGSRDDEFIELVREVRRRLLALAAADAGTYTAVLMQGSGTFALESVAGSVIAPHGRLAVLVNGAYGDRMVMIARRSRTPLRRERAGRRGCSRRTIGWGQIGHPRCRCALRDNHRNHEPGR